MDKKSLDVRVGYYKNINGMNWRPNNINIENERAKNIGYLCLNICV